MVHSPKTEYHDGKEPRDPPIFVLLRPYLEDRLAVAEANDEADPGDLVMPFLRSRTDASLRKAVIRAIENTGQAVWPRLWHSMRRSCITDLMQENLDDLEGVCRWVGCSLGIALKHYWRSTGNAFDRAIAQKAPRHSPAQRNMGANAEETEAKISRWF